MSIFSVMNVSANIESSQYGVQLYCLINLRSVARETAYFIFTLKTHPLTHTYIAHTQYILYECHVLKKQQAQTKKPQHAFE